MSYLIDTDWVVDYLGEQEVARILLETLLPSGIAISIITFSEVYEGIYTGRDPRRAGQAFSAFLRATDVLGISRTVAKHNARIRGELRRQGRPLNHRALDLLIAATAVVHDLTLVTRNIRHYEDVPGLSLHRPGSS